MASDNSAQNARRHGLCSEKDLILADETIEDFKAVDPGCRVKQKSNRRAHVGVVGLVVR